MGLWKDGGQERGEGREQAEGRRGCTNSDAPTVLCGVRRQLGWSKARSGKCLYLWCW